MESETLCVEEIVIDLSAVILFGFISSAKKKGYVGIWLRIWHRVYQICLKDLTNHIHSHLLWVSTVLCAQNTYL